MKHKIMYIISGLILASAILLIVLITFWYAYPYKPLKVNNLSVMTREVRRGSTFIYELDYCKKGEGQAQISRRFVDGVVYSMPDIYVLNPEGCRIINIGIDIPHSLPSGEYRLEIDYSYKVNPIKVVTVKVMTGVFLIVD